MWWDNEENTDHIKNCEWISLPTSSSTQWLTTVGVTYMAGQFDVWEYMCPDGKAIRGKVFLSVIFIYENVILYHT